MRCGRRSASRGLRGTGRPACSPEAVEHISRSSCRARSESVMPAGESASCPRETPCSCRPSTTTKTRENLEVTPGTMSVTSRVGTSIARVWVDDPEAGGDLCVEEPDVLARENLEQLSRLILGDDELDLDGERSRQLEEMSFVQQMVAPEAGHRAERRAAADSEAIGLLQQPLP